MSNYNFFKFSINEIIRKIIIILILLEAILTNTIFQESQIITEIILGILIIYSLISNNNFFLNNKELILLIIFIFVSIISLFINKIDVFLLDAKNYGLAILTLFYVTKTNIKLYYIHSIMFLNIIFILYQYITGQMLFATFVNTYGGAFSDLTDSRPLGLFINTHSSALFLAIYFFYYSKKKNLFFLDYFFLFISGSVFIFISYVIAKLISYQIVKKLIKPLIKFVFLIFITLLVLAFFYKDYILDNDFFIWKLIPDERAVVSLKVIFDQLFQINSYILSFKFFPDDFNVISESGTTRFVNVFGNEIMYFNMIFQGGIVLMLYYTLSFLKYTKPYNIFILLTLIHYGNILVPLSIILFIIYSRKIDNDINNVFDHKILSSFKKRKIT